MDCPKCANAPMKEHRVSTLKGTVVVDRCTVCDGIWFDNDEAGTLKGKWGSEYIDRGDVTVGKSQNLIRDINCPRCAENGIEKRMEQLSVDGQSHIEYEACKEHGMYFDAGEFADFKFETVADFFRGFVHAVTRFTKESS